MKANEIKHIAVVGSGLMGHGIAQEFALAGYRVHLNDVSEEKLESALSQIRHDLVMLQDLEMVTEDQLEVTLNRIHTGTSLKDMVEDVDVVVESVWEDLTLKQKLFKELDHCCPARTILASNSSSLMPSKLASVTKRPDKVLVAHYFNPPYLLPLVEIVRSPETSDESVETIHELLRIMGKKPVIVQKEAPGFIGNRLQAALAREALSIVEKGIASHEDVDTVIKSSFGRRLAAAGVFEIFDIAGWDILLAVWPYLVPDLETSPAEPALLKEKVERGELGVKTGKGFYDWTTESAEELKQRIAKALIEIERLSSRS